MSQFDLVRSSKILGKSISLKILLTPSLQIFTTEYVSRVNLDSAENPPLIPEAERVRDSCNLNICRYFLNIDYYFPMSYAYRQ